MALLGKTGFILTSPFLFSLHYNKENNLVYYDAQR